MLYQPFIHAVLDRADVIAVDSQALLRTTPILKRYKKKCEVVNLWIDKKRFEQCDAISYDIPEHIRDLDNFALFVGVLRWYKGMDILLDAARSTKGQIVIMGKGPLFSRIDRRIREEGITNVRLIGYQNDNVLKYLLSQCRFTVLPSISPAEAFGQILLESCYFHKPMVTTELGTATSYVNMNGKTGIVVPANNAKALSQAMNQLFASDYDCRRFGKNAFIRLNQFFTVEKQAPKYIKIYERLMR